MGVGKQAALATLLAEGLDSVRNMVGVWVDQDECRRAAMEEIIKPFDVMKRSMEDICQNSSKDMTWKSHMLSFARQAGEGVKYLHSSR